jgi:hypothetical protein
MDRGLQTRFQMEFYQSDNAGKIRLVQELKSLALACLEADAYRIKRPMSTEIRLAYAAKGISTDWNFDSGDDVYEFNFLAQRSDLRQSQKEASLLLVCCTQAMESESVTVDMWNRMMLMESVMTANMRREGFPNE